MRCRARQLAVAVGCPLSFGARVVYAEGLDLEQPAGATPIGINCRLCDRADCSARAVPPPGRRLIVDENQQGLAPWFLRVSVIPGLRRPLRARQCDGTTCPSQPADASTALSTISRAAMVGRGEVPMRSSPTMPSSM